MRILYRRCSRSYMFLILLVLALAACQDSVPPSPTAVVETELVPLLATAEVFQPTQTAAEAKDAVVDALLALASQPNRMEVATLLQDGTTYTSVLDFFPPDRKHILDVTSGMEYIIIGQDVYMKPSAQSAWELTDIPASTFMGDQPSDAQSIAAGITDVEVLRTEYLESTPVTVYSYNNTTTVNGIALNSENELWVGTYDGLPYQLVVDGEILAATADPATGESSVKAVPSNSITIITFIPDLVIEAPLSNVNG